MKNLILLLFAFAVSVTIATAQNFNQEIILEGKSPVLLGKINKEALSQNSYGEWFLKNYKAYLPVSEQTEKLKASLSDYTITVFFGTWCGDSKKELPHFYKILNESEFPLERLTVIGVSREAATYKQSPGGEEEGLNIHRVPTFIFYKNGEEVNRIVEHAVTTLEQDMLKIVSNEEYTPNYHAVTIVNDALLAMGLQKFEKKAKRLLPKLKKETKNKYELNTYSHVLFSTEKKLEAIAVARLNTLLYPNEASTFEKLANKQYKTGSLQDALKNYQKSLSLDPKNEQVASKITELLEKNAI